MSSVFLSFFLYLSVFLFLALMHLCYMSNNFHFTMAKNNTNISVTAISDDIAALSSSVRFGLLLGSEISSMACSLFVLYSFIFNPALRRSLPHHAIIILNIFELLFQMCSTFHFTYISS